MNTKRIFTFLLTIIVLLIMSIWIKNKLTVSPYKSENTVDKINIRKVVGIYSAGGVTQEFKSDGSVSVTDPLGQDEYKWSIIESNEKFIKICELQGDIKVNFILYTNSTMYPNKVNSCLESYHSSIMKNFTGKLLVAEDWLNNSSTCEGIYFGANY